MDLMKKINPGEKIRILVEGTPILLVNVNGIYYALEDKCPHMGASLMHGRLDGNHIICPLHKARFDVTTGKNVSDAKIAFLKMKVKDCVTFDVTIENDELFISSK